MSFSVGVLRANTMHADFRAELPLSQHIDHISQAKPGIHPFPAKVYVILVISNPIRYRARYELYRAAEKHIRDLGGIPLTVEAAFGGRPHEITDKNNPWHLQLRTNFELWHKENMVNLGIAHLTKLVPDWMYVAWVDADVTWQRPDVMQETLHQLQHYNVVQMWSMCTDLGPNYDIVDDVSGGEFLPGMVSQWQKYGNEIDWIGNAQYYYPCDINWERERRYHPGHCGYAWASKRPVLDGLGGLIDWSICGANDHHMARGFLGHIKASINPDSSPQLIDSLVQWEKRADEYVKGLVGYVPGLITHHWHGPKSGRGYLSRWKILVEHQYNPHEDIIRDSQGLYRLVGNKRGLRDDLMKYFRQRDEDNNQVPTSSKRVGA